MASDAATELLHLVDVQTNVVPASAIHANAHRLDASAFLGGANGELAFLDADSGQTLSQLAEVFTVYIQTPVLYYVTPFADSRPYLTTSELGEYQCGQPSHVSLLTDPRLIEWEIKRNTIVLSRQLKEPIFLLQHLQ